jgi:hypothetical protein
MVGTVSTPPAAVPAVLRRGPPRLQNVAFHAVAAGLTSLVPVPLLDDVLVRRVRQQLVRSVLGARGEGVAESTVEVLAGAPPAAEPGGRVEGVLKGAALRSAQWVADRTLEKGLRKAVKKAARRVALVLTVKECVDLASGCLHHGWLLQHAVARGDLDPARLARKAHVLQVHAAIHAACAEVDPRPVEQLLRRSRAGARVLRAFSAQALAAWRRRGPRQEQGGPPQDRGQGPEATRLRTALLEACWEEEGYFQSLARRYERHLEAGAPDVPPRSDVAWHAPARAAPGRTAA